MKAQISGSQYKDQAAVTIENGDLAAQFLTSIGAKMCSLVYKPLGLELLVQRPGEQYLLQPYDGDYVAGECSGFDDMFPSIDECFYERYPWKGVRIPDHGEVWSIPWACEAEAGRLHFSTYGVRFPYRLEKWVQLVAADTLRLDYRLTNLSGFEFAFLWAAHTMFYLEEGAELKLPAGVERIVSTLSFGDSLGRYGDELPWPAYTLPDGRKMDLRFMRPKSTGDGGKYYVKGRMPEGWCSLTYPWSGLTLTLSFPVEKVPYLGILPNEGGWQDLYNIFLEPATASFDRIDVARLHGELSTVGPKATYEWYLDINIIPTAGAHSS